MKCIVDDCVKKRIGRGYCSLHYQRLIKRGDPFYFKPRKPKYSNLLDAYNAYVIKNGDDECWGWSGIKNIYGSICINKKLTYAHRFSYRYYVGAIPEGMFVCHKCDNYLCTNPKHLFLGYPKDNSQDMVLKGRSGKGEKNACALLNNEQVIKIKNLLKTNLKQKEIAKIFGINFRIISSIKNNRTWSHIK